MQDYYGAGHPVKSLGTDVPTLVALLVCLIPTTIGALLAAIGIAGMDRALRANILAKSGKAVEVAGDVDTLLLDKTGTITMGNRHATRFIPVGDCLPMHLAYVTALASSADETPEGKSIVSLYHKLDDSLGAAGHGKSDGLLVPPNARFIPFSAQSRMSGVDLADGRRIRKGARMPWCDTSSMSAETFPPNSMSKSILSRQRGPRRCLWPRETVSPGWLFWKTCLNRE